ncbi:DUF6624 domain-containing protein [Flammeovirga sp. SubArs3]|uniref:DUF6624 domain-containing protein n=1 Tax=Flammeovirga sp. SubArs3 TaxID=2995316 RepID=UPI00248BEB89|nr:DUF6624 domain-containing protein [Flammeovirga sp. SubArs3]
MRLIFILLVVLIQCSCTNENDTTSEKPINYSEIKILLDSIREVDQSNRKDFEKVYKKYDQESEVFQSAVKKMMYSDSLNTILVSELLDKYGWIGKDKIGETANSTLFLVIQHSSKEIRLKYIPLLREAVKNKKAKKRQLALMEDRLNLEYGKPQVYGSQVSLNHKGKNYVFPIDDPETVNERRAEMGLEPIEDYLLFFDIKWNLETYYKTLPQHLEELEKKKDE